MRWIRAPDPLMRFLEMLKLCKEHAGSLMSRVIGDVVVPLNTTMPSCVLCIGVAMQSLA